MRSLLAMVKVLVDLDDSPDIVGEAVYETIKRQWQRTWADVVLGETNQSTDDTLKLLDYLLTACPAAAGYQDPEDGVFILHYCCRYINDENLCMAIIRMLLHARKECIRDKNESDGWLAVHHAALKRSLGVMTYLIDCCPLSATVASNRGTTLLQIVLRSYSQTDVKEGKIAYLCNDKRFNHLLRAPDALGLTPLHTALHHKGVSLAIVQTICNAAPNAVSDRVERADISSSWHLALPLHLIVGHMPLTSPVSAEGDIFRYLLARAPTSASQADGRGSTPYTLAARASRKTPPMHPYFKRLLLRACPSVDRDEWRRLNYDERRLALWLGLKAESSDKTFCLWSRGRFPEDLFRNIVSFL